MRINPKATAVLVAVGALFGANYVLVKLAIATVGVIDLTLGRSLIAAVAIYGYCRVRQIKPLAAPLRQVITLGVLSATLPYTLLSLATQLTNAGTGAIINATGPSFTLLIAGVLGIERFSRRASVGLALSWLGVALVSVQRAARVDLHFVLGVLLGLVGTASFAASGIYAKRHFSREASYRTALSQQIVAAVSLAPLALFIRPHASPSALVIGDVLVLGLAGTALAYVLFFWLVSSAGAVSASYVSYLVPVFGVGWGWLALGEQVRALSLVGMFVVLAGLWMLLGAGAASAQPESLVEPAN